MVPKLDRVTCRRRCGATRFAVALWVFAAVAQSAAPLLHAVCSDEVQHAAAHSPAVLVHLGSTGGASSLVGHAPGHAHRGSTHDPTTCPLCRSVQHTTVALAPVAVALAVPPGRATAGGTTDATPPPASAGSGRVSRAPPPCA